MKTLKIILSLLIISITLIVIYELANGLNFDFLEYLDEKYHFLFLTLLTQIFGVYFSSKRWKHCVESYNEGKKILFSFHTYFFLNARANIINNFLLCHQSYLEIYQNLFHLINLKLIKKPN